MNLHFSTVGTIATPPKLSHTADGSAVCSFRLAVTERRYVRDRRAWEDGSTSWFRVSAFRSLAEHAHSSFHVGERVIVAGRLRTRDWEHNEKSGTSVEIEADSLGHDLRWGTSAFAKQLAGIQEASEPEPTGWPVPYSQESP